MNYSKKRVLPFSSTPLEDLLKARGIENPEAYLKIDHSIEINPFLLKNCRRGAETLIQMIQDKKKFLIVVDSDCDGYCSAAIIYQYILDLDPSANIEYVVHEGKQHGLEDHVDWLEIDGNYDMVICPDGASEDFEYHKRLAEKGMTVLILDHHPTRADSENAIVINNQLSPEYENKALCGAGVVYKFCRAIDALLMKSYAPKYLDLVALAEIGDMMDLRIPEVRYYVDEGLKHIQNESFKAFIRKQSYSIKSDPPTPIDISFYVVPLINAIVRVGSMEEKQNMFLAFVDGLARMKSTKRRAGPEDIELAGDQIARLASNARSRQNKLKETAIQTLEQQIIERDLLKNKILILELEQNSKIPNTLTGLIASYFVEKYGRPAFVVRKNKEGFYKGSGRSNDLFGFEEGFKSFILESSLMDYAQGRKWPITSFPLISGVC